nr:dentin sialophosphoprotein-like [Aedes albopictus]
MDKGKYVRPTERAEEDDNGMNSTTETQAEGTNPGLGTVEHDETTDTTNKGNGSASTEPENTSSESSDSESSDTESSDSDVNETGSDKSSGSNDSPDRAPDIESDEETDDGPGLESTLHRTFAPPWLNTTKANSNGVETQQQPTPKTSNDETTNERMDRIEKVLESMASAMKSLQPHNRPTSSRQDAESSWSVPLDNTTTERNSSIVRWDNIKPFPSGVPANKMWEEWNRYIENFEIAALLSNANDPAKRTQLLFLSMGPDLQEIAATRDEAYEAETSQSPDSHVFHVERQTSSNNYRKRRNPDESIRGPYAKRRQIDQGQGRRSRCSRCNLTSHRTGKCPAIDKKCINCGKVGHFAAACRGKRVNAIRFKRENTPDDDQDDERDVEKQVLKN